ncbi:hypothetical protein ABZ532_20420 [Streptomyces sp. NPDC019396]|uniref:hypothetical protein n=1 Tax=Streptomyces sp. NPDC019396 TaxID=3154687 RepID=UPI0033E9DAB7
MSRSLWRRPAILAATAAALALGTACAATPSQSAHAAPHAGRGDRLAQTSDGSRGGLLGQPGEPGKPGLGSRGGDGGRGGDVLGGTGGRGGDGGDGGWGGDGGRGGDAVGCLRLSDLPDKPKQKLTVADKVRIVMVVLYGDVTSAEVAGKYKIPEKDVDAWKQQALDGDWLSLTGVGPPFPS